VSAYQYPAPAPSYPAGTTRDPTAVMGRRTGAWVVDVLLYLVLMAFLGPTPLSPLAEYHEVPAGFAFDEACDAVEQQDDDVVGCLLIDDRVYSTDTTDAIVAALVALAWFLLIYGALQGTKGVTPGKALFGVQVVDEQGAPPGVGKSLLRTLLWVVDGAPWCVPLVGFIAALTSAGHRRIGDMAAKTFVVGKADAGRPVVVPGLTTGHTGGYPGAPGPPGGYGPARQEWGAPPAAGPQTGQSQPGWGTPPPAQPGAWGTPSSPGVPPAGGPGAAPRPTPGPAATGRPAAADQRPAPPTAAPGGWAAPGGEAAPGGDAVAPGRSEPSERADAVAPPGRSGSSERPATETSPTSDETPSRSSQPTDAASTPTGAAADTPAAGAGASARPAQGGYNPQWDAARGTYIVWEPNRGQWLGWDDAAKEWKPL
jgi:uncharacterized RDD family membrane protein YckC